MSEVRQTFFHTFLLNLEGIYGKSRKNLLSPIRSNLAENKQTNLT